MSFMSPPPPVPREATDSDGLPPDDTVRWVPSRKAAVLAAIRDGRIELKEACRRWRLSVEELRLWQRAVDRIGTPGLRVTRVQIYRPMLEEPPSRSDET
ncbi:DUF1153 domain-containing protein [Sandarakinorhabdus rubra]|uniref:DUF1153 domain-containing protein n=1 Tax=Sandarakinorhabdus rubra TaxID=2672568 RepID=UPI001F27EBC8|nr:DUF1153 domain-containing protein [Sandarakinorhabdus rubra]